MCLNVSECVCWKTLSMKCASAYQYVLQLIQVWAGGVNNGSHAMDERVDPTSSPMQADLGGPDSDCM